MRTNPLNPAPALRASRRARPLLHGRRDHDPVEPGDRGQRDDHRQLGTEALQVRRGDQAQLPLRLPAQVPVLDDGPERNGIAGVFQAGGGRF